MSAKKHIIPVFVPHIGCRELCVFCNQKNISGSQKPYDRQDILKLLNNTEFKEGREYELAFYGGSFTAIPLSQQIELLDTVVGYIDKGLISSIRVSTRPDAIDDEKLKILKDYSVKTIELGAQSMNDRVLSLSGRGHSAEAVVKSSKLIKESGFQLGLQMMTGLPGSTDERDIETARKIASLEPDFVRIYPTVIVKGTALERMLAEGSYREHSVEDAVRVCAEIIPIFEDKGIKIIRLALNPMEDLGENFVLGGAYHPALGELASSRLMLNKIREMLGKTALKKDKTLNIYVSPKLLSQAIGQKRENIAKLKKEFQIKVIKIIPKKELCGREIEFAFE